MIFSRRRFALMAWMASCTLFLRKCRGFVILPREQHNRFRITLPPGTASKDTIEPRQAPESSPRLKVPIPKDDNFSPNPIKRLLSLFDSLALSEEKGAKHDVYLEQSGGIWKTKGLGFIESYAVSATAPGLTSALAQAEAKGLLVNSWPDSVVNLLGANSLIAAPNAEDIAFKRARKVFGDALSLKAILSQSLMAMEREVETVVARWETAADDQETIVFQKDISSITFNVIVKAVFGDELSNVETKKIRSASDTIAKGLFAFPIDNVVVRNLPFLNSYALAMEARTQMKEMVENIMTRRRLALANGDTPTGILDALLNADLPDDNIVAFAVDNVILSIFAGFDTSASVTSNLAIILANDGEARDAVREELEAFHVRASIPTGTLEVFDVLPCLQSAVHESFRYRPVVGGSFRKTTGEVPIGDSVIPKDAVVWWNQLYPARSRALYKDPEKACPLRFLHGGSSTEDKLPSPPEPLPQIFGYGKHKCPGQYLAQLEIALIMKAFLTRFDYALVASQDLSPSMPFLAPTSGVRMVLTSRTGE